MNAKKIEIEWRFNLIMVYCSVWALPRQWCYQWLTPSMTGSALPMPISGALVISRSCDRSQQSIIKFCSIRRTDIYYNRKHLFSVINSNHFSPAYQRSVYADFVSLFARFVSLEDVSHKSAILLLYFYFRSKFNIRDSFAMIGANRLILSDIIQNWAKTELFIERNEIFWSDILLLLVIYSLIS